MQRKNIIILHNTEPKPFDEVMESFGNFKKLCLKKGLPYHSLKAFKFPIIYKEYVIYRVPFK